MKPVHVTTLVLVAALAGFGGWFFGRRSAPPSATAAAANANPAAPHERKILFYQSPMHPWIKSDKPGKCTICGMDLVPVYEGDAALSPSPDIVTLNRSSIQVVGVGTAEARVQPLARTLRVAGVIEDDDTRHRIISSYVDGRIEKLAVNYVGAEVVEGQPLAQLYSPILVTAQKEFIDMLTRGAQPSLIAATRERLHLLGLTEAQIGALKPGAEAPTQTEILAPMSGTVVSRTAYEGKYLKEGDPLFEIADYSKMWFIFDVYERDISWLKPGMDVQISVESRPGEIITAPIDFIDPTIEPMSRTAKVRVVLDNPVVDPGPPPRRALKHKLYAEARIALDAPEVLAVPRRAVLDTGDRIVAYVDLGEGAYQQRELKLGRRGDELVEVLAGLTAGEHVVTEGNLILDGQAQLNSSGAAMVVSDAPVAAPGENAKTASAPLAASSLAELETLVDAASSAAGALANDRLDAYTTAAKQLAGAVKLFQQRFHPVDFDRVAALVGALGDEPDLKAARTAFEPAITALADWLRPIRAQNPATLTFKIFECPMAPVTGKGRWVQKEAPLRNPFFGSAMPTCGTEVK